MPSKLRLGDVAYFSSEHPKNSVKCLVSGTGKWTTPVNSKLESLEAEFCLPAPTSISGIDVGNFWSSSVQILVGLADWPQSRREILLKEHTFMTRFDCAGGINKQTMEFFRAEHFQAEVVERKWDRVKLVCRQPFKYNNDVFGLAMLVLHGESEVCGAGEPGSLAGPAVSSLKDFKRKTESLTSSASPTALIPAVLQNLENRRKFPDTEEDSVKPSKSSTPFNASALSRTAKLVLQGQKKQPGPGPVVQFEKRAAKFLVDCQFEHKNFAELELLTFRTVKNLWMEKEKTELAPNEKVVLKALSSQYLTKLVNRKGVKRGNEENQKGNSLKKRKVSDNLQKMRKTVAIDSVENINEKSRNTQRNSVATMDLDSKNGSSDEEIDNIKVKNLKKRHSNTPNKLKALGSSALHEMTDKSLSFLTPETKEVSTFDLFLTPEKTKEVSTFDLTSSPEVSPCKPCSPPPARARPTYNRSHLLAVPAALLDKHGILVQTYNYKKDKQLPLKGGIELNTKVGNPVTFFKVGPDVHLAYGGRLFVPDIQPEHLARVFKQFNPERVLRNDYPVGLEKLQQLSQNGQQDNKQGHNLEQKEIGNERKLEQEDELFGDGATGSSSKRSEEEEDKGECPLCCSWLPLAQLAGHAAECEGPPAATQQTAVCPVCQLEVETDLLERHANQCAASRFGF